MFVDASADFSIPFLLTTQSTRVPVNADAAPIFRVVGSSGLVGDGTASLLESGSITNATAASPVVITTSAAHNLKTGMKVTIASVGGTTGANGTHTITVLSGTTFSLDGSTGGGAYTSGGTWNTTGLYKLTIDGSLRSSLSPGATYAVTVYSDVGSDLLADTIHMTVG